jgi:S2P endopeptidase
VPFQNHVQTGLIPIIPGVNIPVSHLPMFIFVLVIAGIVHELGHAVAALISNVRLNGFGFFIFGIYVGAFTELDTDELSNILRTLNPVRL